MCLGPDPNARLKAEAEEKDKQRKYVWRSKQTAFQNASVITKAQQKDVWGLVASRIVSDLKVGLEQQKGKYFKTKEAYTASIMKNMTTGVGPKGGSVSRQSMLRGGSKAEEYLNKIARAESSYALARGRGQDILLEAMRRQSMAANESLRAKQGLPPQFGLPTTYVPVPDTRGLSTIATGLSIAAQFTPAGPWTKALNIGGMFMGGMG